MLRDQTIPNIRYGHLFIFSRVTLTRCRATMTSPLSGAGHGVTLIAIATEQWRLD